MIEIKRYKPEDKEVWNELMTRSKIDTFLFNRNFIDYHSDRFYDHSFLIYKKGKVEAILPGNSSDGIYYSHQGLTYGGLVSSITMTTTDVLNTFQLVNEEIKKDGIKKVIYKPVPTIYHLMPSQEDIYALYQLGATKIGCNISSTIFLNNKIPFTESRKSGIRKAKKNNISIEESCDFEGFWQILEDNLMNTYNKKPVHSLDEIQHLKNNFPENIKLFTAVYENCIVGGCVLFIMKNIIHIQYISANEFGKQNGALDLLFDILINELFTNYKIFDFGQSTEQMGRYLNNGLIFQKEGFGGRGIVYEIYEYNINI